MMTGGVSSVFCFKIGFIIRVTCNDRRSLTRKVIVDLRRSSHRTSTPVRLDPRVALLSGGRQTNLKLPSRAWGGNRNTITPLPLY
jgi:hypothetical protein